MYIIMYNTAIAKPSLIISINITNACVLLNWNTHYIMNISAMKTLLADKGILTAGQGLSLNSATTKEGEATEWMRHWNNDSRIAVSIAKDTVALITAKDPKAEHLVLQGPETRTSGESGEDYTAYRIVAVTPAEVTL